VREELPDDDRIVQRGDQPQPTPALRHASTSIANARCINAAQLQAREPVFAFVPSAPATSGGAKAVGSARARASGRARPTDQLIGAEHPSS